MWDAITRDRRNYKPTMDEFGELSDTKSLSDSLSLSAMTAQHDEEARHLSFVSGRVR